MRARVRLRFLERLARGHAHLRAVSLWDNQVGNVAAGVLERALRVGRKHLVADFLRRGGRGRGRCFSEWWTPAFGDRLIPCLIVWDAFGSLDNRWCAGF